MAIADLSKEDAKTFDLYGPDAKKPGTFANTVLTARRLVEKGVRFVQIYHNNWDHHGNLGGRMPDQCKDMKTDYPGRITRLEPLRLLSYTFEAAGPESEVTFELEPRGKDLLLVITHRRIVDRKTMINVASGWDTHVAILADRLNGVEPRPFWSTHAKLVREYEGRL